MHPLRSTRQLGAPSCLFIYQPFSDTPLNECGVTLKHHRELGFISNLRGWEGGGFNYVDAYTSELPTIRLRSGGGRIKPNEESILELEVVDPTGSTIDRPVDVSIKSTGGYLPIRSTSSHNGVCRFRVCASLLMPGESFVVFAGIGSRERILRIPYEVRED
jgi:hypothetical protein